MQMNNEDPKRNQNPGLARGLPLQAEVFLRTKPLITVGKPGLERQGLRLSGPLPVSRWLISGQRRCDVSSVIDWQGRPPL